MIRVTAHPRGLWPLQLAILLSMCAPSQSSAESAATNKALAEALFDEGKKLMAENDFAHACPKFERSQELDEGIGTLLFLADCYEKNGQIASAWATFREAGSRARARGETDRERTALRRTSVLEPLLAKLTLEVDASSDLQGLTVTRNAQRVPHELWGISSPVDPGVQNLDATAPGKRPWHGSVTLADGETRIVKIPRLLDAPVQSPPARVAGVDVAPNSTLSSEPPPAPLSADNTSHTAAYALGAIGVAGFAVGTGFGLSAMSRNSVADAHCERPGGLCDATGVAAGHDVNQRATISNIAFGVGAAASIGAVILYFAAPGRGSKSASIQVNVAASNRAGGLTLAGAL